MNPLAISLITSQIDTAPKHHPLHEPRHRCLITSQIDTAPKPRRMAARAYVGLITSQIDTAPKHLQQREGLRRV